MAAPGSPVTAQQAHIIIQSAQIFDEGVNAMNSIYNEVFTAQDTLRGQAMVTTAGSKFSAAVVEWTNDFNDIKSTLSNMAAQLMSTTQQTTTNNQRNLELASGLGNLTLPH